MYLGAAIVGVAAAARAEGFANVGVAAGESVPVSVFIPRDDIAYWTPEFTGWWSNRVHYTVHVGSSSRDIRLSAASTSPATWCGYRLRCSPPSAR